jgi:plasmid stability protein
MRPLWIKRLGLKLLASPCAIIDSSDIIDGMASITIRQLPETTKRKLRIRAAQNGRSMEQEAREILRIELNKSAETNRPPQTGKDLVKAIRDIFEPLGGVDLQIPPRGPIRDPGIR